MFACRVASTVLRAHNRTLFGVIPPTQGCSRYIEERVALLLHTSKAVAQMGSDYSSLYGPLPLVPQAPGAVNVLQHPHLFHPHATHLVMKGKLFSMTDSSVVRHLDGREYVRVRGRLMSITDKHTIETLDGQPLFNVKNVSRSRSFC